MCEFMEYDWPSGTPEIFYVERKKTFFVELITIVENELRPV